MKITEQLKVRNFSHLQVGGVYGTRRLMSKQMVEGGCLCRWVSI